MADPAEPRLSVLGRQRALLLDMLDSVGATADAGGVSGALAPYSRNGGDPMVGRIGGGGGGGVSGVSGGGAPFWKVLVYDAPARDIIAPLLQVSDLRAHGVTLHLSATAQRQAIPDVPAVYLLAPTPENVALVAADASAGLYDGLHVHWTSSLSRELLESLADAVVRAGVAAAAVATVYDLYANFLSLEHNLFSLNLPPLAGAIKAAAAAKAAAVEGRAPPPLPPTSETFAALHAAGVTDGAVEAVVSAIVDGLFCVCATLTAVPIIRAPRGGAAEMVASQLDARLREQLRTRNSVLLPDVRGGAPPAGAGAAAMAQPVLVILDRTVDLAVMLHHAWTYQALASDVLGVRLNRVRVAASDEAGGGAASPTATTATRTYDLDSARDEFWAANAHAPFPAVADAVAAALTEYQGAVADISRTAGAVGGGGGDDVSLDAVAAQLDATASAGAGVGADKLAAALTRLPALRKRKALIDMHTTIATALLEAIHRRGIDALFTMEEELLAVAGSSGGTAAAAAAEPVRVALDWVRSGGASRAGATGGAAAAPRVAATDEDRLRLALIAALCAPDERREGALEEAAAALKAAGVTDTRAFAFVRANKRFTRSVSAAALGPGSSLGIAGAAAAPGHRRALTSDSNIGLGNSDADVGTRLLSGSASMASAASALAASTQLEKVVSSAVQLGVQGFHTVAANLNKRLTNAAEKACATSRIVDALMGGGSDGSGVSGGSGDAGGGAPSAAATALVNGYGYWDPRSPRGARPSGRPRHQDAIVFVVGGGNYVEYHNVMEHAGRGGNGRRRVVYGATEMVTGDAFLAQLQALGGPPPSAAAVATAPSDVR